MLSLMLQRNNHSVITASNGPEALQYLEQSPIDLVIADVNMPGMDGLALLNEVRGSDRFKDLPVIMLTASGKEQVRLGATQKGANGFLTKPTSSRELIEMVERYTAG
jgi:CheY-like chemotaxis protein